MARPAVRTDITWTFRCFPYELKISWPGSGANFWVVGYEGLDVISARSLRWFHADGMGPTFQEAADYAADWADRHGWSALRALRFGARTADVYDVAAAS